MFIDNTVNKKKKKYLLMKIYFVNTKAQKSMDWQKDNCADVYKQRGKNLRNIQKII